LHNFIYRACHDLSRPVATYIALVSVTACGVAATLVITGFGLGNPIVVLALVASTTLAERGHVALRAGKLNMSVSLLPAIFAAMLFGPLAGMLVFGSAAVFLDIPVMGRVAYIASRSTIGAMAGGAASAIFTVTGTGVGAVVAASLTAAAVAAVADAGVTSLTFWLRGHGSWSEAAKDLIPIVLTAVPIYSPALALLVLAYRDVSPWTLPLFLVPALAAQRWFLLYQEQRRLASDMIQLNERLEAANLSFATALVATLDARDRYTAGHSAAVAVYARDIAERMALGVGEQRLAHLCGLVHDIGKIGLPAGLLEKPGALTLDERREMQRHSEIGEKILANVETYAEIAAVVRHHHERVDGNGYPDGVEGDKIPLLARIIGVADAYNAMTSDRPYRDAMPTRVARLRLAQAVETQFDTAVVAAFEAILAGASEEYRRAQGDEFFWMAGAPKRTSLDVSQRSLVQLATG
jgi:putative nucleotidyltransferase with HDIG domain